MREAFTYDDIRKSVLLFFDQRRQQLAPLSPAEREISVKRGDLYFADLDPVIGSEQGGIRPVLIIQNDLGNRFSPTVIVLPLTSRQGKASLRTHVPLLPPQGGVKKPSIILCEQVRTLEKSRLRQYIGRITKEKMALVERALAAAVGQEEENSEEKNDSTQEPEQES